MYQPFTATAAPISYNGNQMVQQPAPAAYINQQPVYGNPAPSAYGMVSYPTGPGSVYPGTAVYGNQQQQGGATYSGLDAAVYSAASAMLVERGITPQQKTYSHPMPPNQNISGYPSGNINPAWGRIEAMNPTISASAPSGGGGGTRGGRGGSVAGFSNRGGRGGPRGGYGGRYGQDKPKDPANQAVHYCEVCKVSCAGQVSFQAHMIGSKHKKREQQAKWENEKDVTAATGEGGQAQPPANPQRMSNFNRATQKCELCGVMTAGAAAYDAHIKGKSHQRTLKLHMSLGKPIPVNEPTVIQRTVDTANPRLGASKPELATGSSICTKVVTGGKTILITPKMNFVGGTVLHTTESGLQETMTADGATAVVTQLDDVASSGPEGTPAPGSQQKALKRNSTPAKHNVNPNATQEPIGESYIQKTEKAGKVAYYKCTLCDCEFSDDSGMNSHIRGRRHRLAYQKKVDPTIVVDMPNSLKKVKALQEARASRGGRGGGRGGLQVAVRGKRPAPGGPYAGPPGPKRMAYAPHSPSTGPWGGQSGYVALPQPMFEPYRPQYGGPPRQHGGLLPSPNLGGPYGRPPAPYYTPVHGQAPAFQRPRLPSVQQPLPFDQDAGFEEDQPMVQGMSQSLTKQAPRLDQQYLLHKHRQVVPRAKDVESLQQTVTNIEKALKNLAERLMLPKVTDPAGEAPTDGAPDTVASDKSAKKMLKGSFRFGAFTKNLLTKDNVFAEILLISVRHPSAEDLNTVAEALQTELKVVCPSVSYIVVAHVDQCGIFVKALEPQSPTTEDGVDIPTVPLAETVQSDGSFPVWIYLAYGSLRDDLFRANAEKTTANGDGSPEEAATSGSIGATTAPSVAPQGETANTATGVALAPAATLPTTSTAQSPAVPMENGHLTAAAAGNQSAVDVFSNGLDLKRSLTVLAQSRRTRWFQEFISFFPQCRMLMRLLNQVCDSHVDLRLLVGWPIEFLTISTLRIQAAYHGVTPFDIPLAEAFWMILSNVAGGVFLPGCPNGFKDPCERGDLDILGAATLDERVKITKAVSDLISRWLSGDYAKVLAVEPLDGDPLYQMEVTDSALVALQEAAEQKVNDQEAEVTTEVASLGESVNGLTH